MYVPDAFRVDDPAVLHAAIRENAFGLLVTVDDGEPFASHVPFLLDEATGPRGMLLFHLARANPQAAALARGCPALAVFQGPHGYISPAWYEDRAASVPTWNFIAVHARGTAAAMDDERAVDALLRRLSARYEAGMPEPWTPGEMAPQRLAGMRTAIVAFS
ncbi:MAG TPA: FMN-binding negative transcriptional regulator, partial [Arenibaculum sp.]|nr:FMN-binding negative transcriptional regulator [Arenibaculum sp.]